MAIDKINFDGTEIEIPRKTSQLENDSNFITAQDIPSVEGLASETYVNESVQRIESSIPKKVSELENDSEFVTETGLTEKGYATTTQLENSSNSTLESAKTYTDEKVANLVGTAPETLDTLQEVATAIQENETVVEALNSAIGNKVDKVDGKGLSTNDYTTAEKQKLAGVEEGANNYVLPNEVVQDASYVHTDNNYTTSEKEKLASLTNYDDTALSNRITAVETKNNEQDAIIANKADKTEIPDTSALEEEIATKLPLSGGTMTGPLVISGGNAVSGVGNIQLDTDGQITAKGTNFTLFGRSNETDLYLGYGSYKLIVRGNQTRPSYNGKDIALTEDIPNDYVSYNEQALTDEQKAQVKTNLGIQESGGTDESWTPVYDMSSTDESLNWGYTAGITPSAGIIANSIDFTAYKYMRIHYVSQTRGFGYNDFNIEDARDVTSTVPSFNIIRASHTAGHLIIQIIGLRYDTASATRKLYVGAGYLYTLTTSAYLTKTALTDNTEYYVSRIEVK